MVVNKLLSPIFTKHAREHPRSWVPLRRVDIILLLMLKHFGRPRWGEAGQSLEVGEMRGEVLGKGREEVRVDEGLVFEASE